MKRSVVPAQITTVEDKVLGNLSAVQAGLICSPLIFGILFYAGLPPHFHLALYKVGLIIGLEIIGVTLSIRKEDQLLAFWLAMRLKYNFRPRFYVYDKNDLYLRPTPNGKEPIDTDEETAPEIAKPIAIPTVPLKAAVRLSEIMADPQVNLRFKTGKNGKGLYAVANEIK